MRKIYLLAAFFLCNIYTISFAVQYKIVLSNIIKEIHQEIEVSIASCNIKTATIKEMQNLIYKEFSDYKIISEDIDQAITSSRSVIQAEESFSIAKNKFNTSSYEFKECIYKARALESLASWLKLHSDIDQIKKSWDEIESNQPRVYKYLKPLKPFFADPKIPFKYKYTTAYAMWDISIQKQDNKKYIYLISKELMDLEKIKVYNTKLGKKLELFKLIQNHIQEAEIINQRVNSCINNKLFANALRSGLWISHLRNYNADIRLTGIGYECAINGDSIIGASYMTKENINFKSVNINSAFIYGIFHINNFIIDSNVFAIINSLSSSTLGVAISTSYNIRIKNLSILPLIKVELFGPKGRENFCYNLGIQLHHPIDFDDNFILFPSIAAIMPIYQNQNNTRNFIIRTNLQIQNEIIDMSLSLNFNQCDCFSSFGIKIHI